LRLDPRFRCSLFAALAVLFVTGAVWLVADQLKAASDGELWQSVAANLLMVHGGTAMVTLLLLGALFPLHVRLSWRSRRNRITGTIMVTIGTILIATAFGLYYSGSETLRPWMSWIHTFIGLALPLFIGVHILIGRCRHR
jgi:sulfite exporter TauE/SafE